MLLFHIVKWNARYISLLYHSMKIDQVQKDSWGL